MHEKFVANVIEKVKPDVTGEAARIAFKELVEAGKARGIIAVENGEPPDENA